MDELMSNASAIKNAMDSDIVPKAVSGSVTSRAPQITAAQVQSLSSSLVRPPEEPNAVATEKPLLVGDDVCSALLGVLSHFSRLGVGLSMADVLPSPLEEKSKSLSLTDLPLASASSLATKKPMLNMLDCRIERSVAERFAMAMSDKVDPSKMTLANKDYTTLWTNRVAMWRFFDRYVSPVIRANQAQVAPYFAHHLKAIEMAGVDPGRILRTMNPFANFEHAFPAVLAAWTPVLKKIVRLFERNTRSGQNLTDDFTSISMIAFLHALEKQAMAMLGNPKQVQSLPFPNRVEFAVRKAIYSEIPDLTGPVRVPVESKHRKNMPTEVSLDAWDEEFWGSR